jgi:hypothetical protein
MIRLVCIVEVEEADTIEDAQASLDRFREAVLPSINYGLTIYRADAALTERQHTVLEELDGIVDALRAEWRFSPDLVTRLEATIAHAESAMRAGKEASD